MATRIDETPQHRAASAPVGEERSLGQIASEISTTASTLVRDEIALAKVEIKEDAVNAGKGAGMFAGAGVIALYGLGLLLLGLVYVLNLWLPLWASFLIVAAVLFLIAGILAMVGKKNVSQVKGKPEKAIHQGKETVADVKAAAKPADSTATVS